MISTSNVSLSFGGRKLFDDVDIKFTPGNCYGLIGANGAGKTTLFRVMTGFEGPTSGQVNINNFDLRSPSKQQIAQFRRTIGVVFQDFKLLCDRSVFDNVALPLMIQNKHKWEVLEKVEDKKN